MITPAITTDLPYIHEISCVAVKAKADERYNEDCIAQLGEIIIKIDCQDGIFYLLRERHD